MTEQEIEDILEMAADAAVDVIVARMDVQETDSDYQERRKYARERLSEFLCEEVVR